MLRSIFFRSRPPLLREGGVCPVPLHCRQTQTARAPGSIHMRGNARQQKILGRIQRTRQRAARRIAMPAAAEFAGDRTDVDSVLRPEADPESSVFELAKKQSNVHT